MIIKEASSDLAEIIEMVSDLMFIAKEVFDFQAHSRVLKNVYNFRSLFLFNVNPEIDSIYK